MRVLDANPYHKHETGKDSYMAQDQVPVITQELMDQVSQKALLTTEDVYVLVGGARSLATVRRWFADGEQADRNDPTKLHPYRPGGTGSYVVSRSEWERWKATWDGTTLPDENPAA